MNTPCSFQFFIFASAVIFLLCIYQTGAATCHPDDEAGLLAFKSGITQDPSGILNSWKKGTDCCTSWYGVSCRENRVVFLTIDGHSFDAKPFILSGTISPSLAKLRHLESLGLINLENITGSFPQSLFRLPKLQFIELYNNRLSGRLPANIGKQSQLLMFVVKDNLFTGTIPLGFANFNKNLVYLDVSDNQLSGTIPDIFKSMTSLQSLHLSRNSFSGELPPSIASLSPSLWSLDLNKNNLSGSIPSYFSRFEKLEKLDLSWNQFSGTVPKSVSNLTKLVHIDLSHNLLTGPLPVLNVKDIKTLDLSYNEFHLKTIPKWMTSSPTINSLRLAKCGINMSFSDWKPNKAALYEDIDLSENQISGSPERFLKKQNILKVFRAPGNKLRFDMGKLNFSTTLVTLDLSRNLIFGNVPATVARLDTLYLSQNHLCGKLPVTKFPANVFAGNDCLCGSPLAPCKPEELYWELRLEPKHTHFISSSS